MTMMLNGPANGRARVIYVSRSDGRLYASDEVNNNNSSARYKGAVQHVVGEPIPQDTLQLDDQRTVDQVHRWKIVVGTGVADEMAWPRDSQYQLILPDRFALRWHNPDNQDRALRMYGHPAGCSDDFLYKEPYEFIPHVLWLLSDSEDRRACPCKPCHRATGRKVPRSLVERLQAEVAAKQQAAAAAAAPHPPAETKPKKGAGSKTTAMATKKKAAAAAAAEVIGAKASAKDPAAGAKPTKRTAAAPKTAASTPVAAPSPSSSAAPPAAAAQQLLVNNEPTLFRRGEMVWYQKSSAWRIGVIRQVGAAPTHAYTIAPLGHALLSMPDLVKQQQQMRPFLTFSVPGVGLEDIPNTIFSEVPWQELIKHANHAELVGLEASKMAALEIDSSWSVFNRLAPQPQDPPAQQQQPQPKNQTRYDGAFLGAEMVRRGDPIRHKDKSRGTLLEVAEIIVTSTTVVPAPGAGPSSSSSSTTTTPQPPTRQDFLSFRGVEYEAALVPEVTYVTKQPQGAIFAKDTAFRSAVAKAGGANQKCVWTIKSWDATWHEVEVGGRSYVTDELIHVTTGAEAVQQALQTGKFTEAPAFLNNRMQNQNAQAALRSSIARPNRRATVGQAVSQAQPLKPGEGIVEDQ